MSDRYLTFAREAIRRAIIMFMAHRVSLWGEPKQVQKGQEKPTKLRKFYESAPPVEPPDPAPGPVQVAAPADMLEAGAWEKPPPATEKLKKPPGNRRVKRGNKPLLPAEKSRNRAVSVSMSHEEEDKLRTFASEKGINFSEWARQVLFREARIPIPARPVSLVE